LGSCWELVCSVVTALVVSPSHYWVEKNNDNLSQLFF